MVGHAEVLRRRQEERPGRRQVCNYDRSEQVQRVRRVRASVRRRRAENGQ